MQTICDRKWLFFITKQDIHQFIYTFVGPRKGCTSVDSCCTNAEPCGQFEGSCDQDDSLCSEGLKCGYDNCVKSSKVDIVFGSHFDCCYPGLSIKEKDANTEIIFFFLLLLEAVSLSCKDTDAGTSECEEVDSTCFVKRVGNFFLMIFIVQSYIKRFLLYCCKSFFACWTTHCSMSSYMNY